jgi:AcrR family transcriptional regulator
VITAASPRERILQATFDCVARYGIAKTTVEDAARVARLSRATVYRHFPGGKDQLISETIAWETARFFERLRQAVAGTTDIAQLLEEAILFAHRSVVEHAVLQKVLQTEPDRLLPALTSQANALVGLVAAFLEPGLAAANLRPGQTPPAAADYVARLMLSVVQAPGRGDLGDREQVRDLIRTELLGGVLVA